jgi:signal transduction histidine kinase
MWRRLRAVLSANPDGSFEEPLWRALAVFRLASLVQVFLLLAYNRNLYLHPAAASMAGFGLAAWSIYTIYGYGQPRHRGWPLLTADMTIVGLCLLASVPIEGHDALVGGVQTLPASAIAGPVVAWAIYGGRRLGAIGALIIGACDLFARASIDQNTLTGTVLLLLAGIAVGHISRLGYVAEGRLARAVQMEAATRERERLARDIHDSVLQVLALVAHRAAALGGEAAELGRLAGEQEAALRALIGSSGAASALDGSEVDLRSSLERFASRTVDIVAPATPVMLPARTRDELVAAVASALDNVRRHCVPETRAWVLVEDESGAITVTVRDDGPGIAAGRLDEAEAAGRLGVAQSIRGRMRDLGGSVAITSMAGDGTEVEMTVPRLAT